MSTEVRAQSPPSAPYNKCIEEMTTALYLGVIATKWRMSILMAFNIMFKLWPKQGANMNPNGKEMNGASTLLPDQLRPVRYRPV